MKLNIHKRVYKEGHQKKGDEVVVNSVAVVQARYEVNRDTSDDALIRQAQKGDFSAFETLFEKHRTMVYRYSYQLVGRRDDAEDLVQESFVRAFVNISKYRDQAKFTTWLLRIVTNLATDHARMHTRRTHLETQEAKGGLTWMTVGSQVDPQGDLDQSTRTELLRFALSQLSARHRTAVVLRDVEEKEYAEIAEILKCSVGGAKLRVLRARRALQNVVSQFSKDSVEGLHV